MNNLMVERILFCNKCEMNTVHIDHSWLPAAVICKRCNCITEYDDMVFEDDVSGAKIEFFDEVKNFDK